MASALIVPMLPVTVFRVTDFKKFCAPNILSC